MKKQQKGSCFTTSRWGAIILLKYQYVNVREEHTKTHSYKQSEEGETNKRGFSMKEVFIGKKTCECVGDYGALVVFLLFTYIFSHFVPSLPSLVHLRFIFFGESLLWVGY